MTTSIEWTQNPDGSPGRTWNPTRGCEEISPGCARCYAKTFAERWRGVKGHPYEQGFDPRLVLEKLWEPLSWRKPTRVFVNSMSDLWLDGFDRDYIAAVFGVMAACPQHTFITLTKRADRLIDWFEWMAVQTGGPMCHAAHAALMQEYEQEVIGEPFHAKHCPDPHGPWPLPNVWVGTSVENKKHGVPRIGQLRKVPATVRVLSIEPLLEDLGDLDLTGIGWVLVGGESGPRSRLCELAWIRKVVAQCREQGVPVFVKQVGAMAALDVQTTGEFRAHKNGKRQLQMMITRLPTADRKGGEPAEWPVDLRVRQFPEVRNAK